MSARLTYLTTILPKLAHRMIRDARGRGVTHHTERGGPLILQPCHLDRENPGLTGLVRRDIDRLAAALALIIEAQRELASDPDLPAPAMPWPRLVGPCKSACTSDLQTIDLLGSLGGEVHPRGRGNGLPSFPPDEAPVRLEERERIISALTPALAHILRAMGRRYQHDAMIRLANRFDGGIGSPMQRVMEEEVGLLEAPDLVFLPGPVVGKARVAAVRERMAAVPPSTRLVPYMKQDFADDVDWVRRGAPRVPSHEPERPRDAVMLSPELLGPRNHRISSWTTSQSDLFAVGLFWAVLLDQAVYTWRRESHATWAASLPAPFPKLVGDCPGGCGSHQEPHLALEAVGRMRDDDDQRRVVERRTRLLRRSIPEMKSYAISLLERGGVRDPDGLWAQCQQHLPSTGLILLDMINDANERGG